VLAFRHKMLQAFPMALSYKPVDRDQLFLLPPDIRKWLPEDHLAFFVLDVVERIDTGALHDSHPNDGAGRQAYDPEMLLALLLYAYATGERSSRRIERLCEMDLAFRVIAANHRPDHTTLARFRAEKAANIAALFTEVLRLCREAGLLSLGVIAVDGTKLKANASKRANRTRDQIDAEVERLMAEAAATDAEEDATYGERRGDELPEDLADPRRRKARLDAALEALGRKQADTRAAEEAAEAKRAELERRSTERGIGVPGPPRRGSVTLERLEAELAASQAAYAARFAEWKIRSSAARARGEPVPLPPNRHRKANARRRLEAFKASTPPSPTSAPEPPRPVKVNVTDPDSQIMKAPGGWVQGYNAQAAVNDGGIVVSARVTTSHSDTEQCQPMMRATREDLDAAGVTEPIGTLLFDAGYCSEANITAPGPERLIATAKSWKLRRQAREQGFAEGEPDPGASALRQMEHRLRTEEGSTLYGLRQTIVEPAFGDLKENLGYRSFARRGLEACDAEWKLMCAAKNIAKLFRATRPIPGLA